MTSKGSRPTVMSAEDQLVEQLRRARMEGGLVPRPAADCVVTLAAAYDVQRKIANWPAMAQTGWKVGATSAEPQKLLGTNEPATAPMFQPFCFESPATVSVFPGHEASIEGEFAFRFSRALPPRPSGYSLDEVLDAVETLMPAIEVVGCRFDGGFDGLGAIRLVADMTAHTAFVSGRGTAEWRELDLPSHAVRLFKNDKQVAEGCGASVLDGPLSVLEWTANHLSRLGQSIKAGEVVTTGTCTGITPVRPGDRAMADFGHLGRVELQIVAA